MPGKPSRVSKPMGVRLANDVYAEIENLARALRWSRSEVAAWLIGQALAAQGWKSEAEQEADKNRGHQ